MAKYLTTIAAAGFLGLGAILACGGDNPVEPKNEMPVAEASASPMQGHSPLTVDFDGRESYDSDGTIVKYIWSFGDGVKDSTSGITASHMYETVGSYTYSLTVVDNDGGRGSKTLEDINVTQPPINNSPQTSLTVTPPSGVVPLNVRVQYSCTDADPNDIEQSYLTVGSDTLITTSIDSIFTFTEPGTYTTGAYCRDKAGAESIEGPIDTEATAPQKSLSQTADLTNYVDINLTLDATNISEATRDYYHNGNLTDTRTFSNFPHFETLTDRLIGNWRFIATAPGARSDTVEVDVPDYESEAPDLSGINLDANENTSTDFHIPRATDKNKEQHPIKYTGVTATEGVEATLGTFPNDTVLTITTPGIIGPDPIPYSIELAREGSPDKITLEGRVLDVPVPVLERIAFLGYRNGNKDVYLINPDGTGIKKLTTNPSGDAEPSWSPDGSKIAFRTNREDVDNDGMKDNSIYVMDADGSNQRRLTPDIKYANNPAWSPNGDKIAFSYINSGFAGIAVINSDGTGFTRLVEEPESPFIPGWPSWSPDGSKMAFFTYRDGNWEIYTMNSDGSNQFNFTNNPAVDQQPAWSPDGSRIAFMSNRADQITVGEFDIYTKNIDGSNISRITDASGREIDPAWSSDGSKFAFTRVPNVGDPFHIYTMKSDGTGWQQITFEGQNRYPAFRPRQ